EAKGFSKAMSARTIFTGFGIGLLYKSAMVALKGWKDTPQKVFGAPFTAGSVSAEISRELLGVGYIIGPKIASVMCAGGVLAYLVARPLHMNVLGAILLVITGFLFVTVSSRLTGEIGSSSNPIPGMTVATLLLTCLVFLLVGWTGGAYYVTALSVGGIVCIAA